MSRSPRPEGDRASILPRSPATCIAIVAAGWQAACVKQLPPARTPEPRAPAVAAGPPAAGASRLVVDVVEGPTRVDRIRIDARPIAGRTSVRLVELPEVLCPASPCVVDTSPGNVLLGFPVQGDPDAEEIELVHVGPAPSVYRRSLSVYHDDSGALRVLGIVATSLGGCAAITGVVLLPIGLDDGNRDLATAGGITLGAGALLLAAGILAIRADSPTYRPGASNHFPLGVAGE